MHHSVSLCSYDPTAYLNHMPHCLILHMPQEWKSQPSLYLADVISHFESLKSFWVMYVILSQVCHFVSCMSFWVGQVTKVYHIQCYHNQFGFEEEKKRKLTALIDQCAAPLVKTKNWPLRKAKQAKLTIHFSIRASIKIWPPCAIESDPKPTIQLCMTSVIFACRVLLRAVLRITWTQCWE